MFELVGHCGMVGDFCHWDSIVGAPDQVPERVDAEGVVEEFGPIGDLVSIVRTATRLRKDEERRGVLIVRPEQCRLGPFSKGLHRFERLGEFLRRQRTAMLETSTDDLRHLGHCSSVHIDVVLYELV